MATKQKLTPAQRAWESHPLCEPHAHSLGMPEGSFERVEEAKSADSDEPVECSLCTVGIMRRAGVV